MDFCRQMLELSHKICDFIENGENVGEESLTDYLIWKLKKVNLQYNFFRCIKFTRSKENKIGADFELIFHFIDRNNNQDISFVIQAKKLFRNSGKKTVFENDGYCGKLKYPENTCNQLNTLLCHCEKNRKFPFYLFYTQLDKRTQVKCEYIPWNIIKSCIVLVDAYSIKNIVETLCNGCGRNSNRYNLKKEEIIKEGNPFCCLFCCPLARGTNPGPIEHLLNYLESYYPNLFKERKAEEYINAIPEYVEKILDNKLSFEDLKKYGLLRFDNGREILTYRGIAIFDLTQKRV